MLARIMHMLITLSSPVIVQLVVCGVVVWERSVSRPTMDRPLDIAA